MEKSLSVTGTILALVFAVSLAACQQQPNAPSPAPIETIQSAPTPVELEKTPAPATSAPTPKEKPKVGKTSTQTKTPRLDSLEKRVKRLEDLARSYGAPI